MHALSKKPGGSNGGRLAADGEHAPEGERSKVHSSAEGRLKHLLQHSPVAFYALHPGVDDNRAYWVSDNVEQIVGYKPSEVTQENWWSSHVHPGDWNQALSAKHQLGDQGHSALEYRIRHKNGEYRWVREEQKLARDGEGQPAEILGTWIDVTDRKHLEERFHQAQKMEAMGQLASGVAHDFNNLILVMRGHAEMLQLTAERPSPQTDDSLNQIMAAADRAANLTRQLLAFSRKQVMQSQPLGLNDLIANLTKMLKRIIGEQVRLQCEYAPQLPFIEADPGMLEQVLVNLVVNARDAMPEGGRLLISTEAVTVPSPINYPSPEAQPGHFVRLSVSDTGTGIAPEHLSRIFEPFFTTKEPGKGTGLGLATVCGIVKQHHGWIDVSSKPGAGSTFNIYLPSLASRPAAALDAIQEPELRRGTETILVVEDEDAVRSLTRRLLERFGYSVLEASSGREALAKCKAGNLNFKLLLTDVIMPQGVNGRDLAEQLRRFNPELKVIFLSGYTADVGGKDPSFLRQARTRFLQKPCPWRNLLLNVRQCLDEP